MKLEERIEKRGTMRIYDIIYKRGEDKNGKARWERVGNLYIDENGKMKIKLDLIPVNFDGWLVVKEKDSF